MKGKKYHFVFVPHLDFLHLRNALIPGSIKKHDYLEQESMDNFIVGNSIFLSSTSGRT